MAKEFAGGAIPPGFARVPLNWVADQPEPTAITAFDFAALDSLDDIAAEAVAAGESLGALLEETATTLLCHGTPAQLARWLPRQRTFFWSEGYKDAIADQMASASPKLDAWLLS